MGTINNIFTCVEMQVSEEEAVDEIYDACYEHYSAIAYVGANHFIFVTIVPSGSKEGWGTASRHKEATQRLLGKLKQIDPNLIVTFATTSCG